MYRLFEGDFFNSLEMVLVEDDFGGCQARYR